MADLLTPEQKKAAFEKKAKIVLAIGAGLLFAPFAAVAIGGLIGLCVAVAIAIVGINLAPVFARKMANLKMKMIMDEARKNPIEAMNTIYLDNMQTIKAADEKIRNFAARLGDFKSNVKDLAARFPSEAKDYQDMVDKLTLVLRRRIEKQRVAKAAAASYHDKMDRADAIYAIAKEANSMQELAGDMQKQVFQDIEKKVAFDSVNHEFNLAVSELTLEVETDPDFGTSHLSGVAQLELKEGQPTVEAAPTHTHVRERELEA